MAIREVVCGHETHRAIASTCSDASIGAALAVEELARIVGVSRRTLFRDLELLERAGISYSYDRATKRYSTTRAMMLPPVTFSHAEALAVMLSTRYLLARRIFRIRRRRCRPV